jgi:hypothetical protein
MLRDSSLPRNVARLEWNWDTGMIRNDSRCVVGRGAVAGHVRAIDAAAPFAQPLQKSHLLQNRILTSDTVGIKLDSDGPRVEIVQPYFDFKCMPFGTGRHIDCSESQGTPIAIQRMLPFNDLLT